MAANISIEAADHLVVEAHRAWRTHDYSVAACSRRQARRARQGHPVAAVHPVAVRWPSPGIGAAHGPAGHRRGWPRTGQGDTLLSGRGRARRARPGTGPEGGRMGAYQTVLVGTDGSDSSYRAVDRAAEIARDATARLVIVCAYEPATPREVAAAEDVLGDEAFSVVGSAPAEETLRTAAERAAARGAGKIERVAVAGEPVKSLFSALEEHQADLLVVGNRGLNTLAGQAARVGAGGRVPPLTVRRADRAHRRLGHLAGDTDGYRDLRRADRGDAARRPAPVHPGSGQRGDRCGPRPGAPALDGHGLRRGGRRRGRVHRR